MAGKNNTPTTLNGIICVSEVDVTKMKLNVIGPLMCPHPHNNQTHINCLKEL